MNIRKISILELSHEEKDALLVVENIFKEILNTVEANDDEGLHHATNSALTALEEFQWYLNPEFRI